MHRLDMPGIEQLVIHGDEDTQTVFQLILVNYAGAGSCEVSEQDGD